MMVQDFRWCYFEGKDIGHRIWLKLLQYVQPNAHYLLLLKAHQLFLWDSQVSRFQHINVSRVTLLIDELHDCLHRHTYIASAKKASTSKCYVRSDPKIILGTGDGYACCHEVCKSIMYLQVEWIHVRVYSFSPLNLTFFLLS